MAWIQLSLKSRHGCRIAQKYFICVCTKYWHRNICVKTEVFLKTILRSNTLVWFNTAALSKIANIDNDHYPIFDYKNEIGRGIKRKKNRNEFSDCESSFRSIRGFSDLVKSRRSGRSGVYRRSRSGSIQNL